MNPDDSPPWTRETVHAAPLQPVNPAEDSLGHCDMAIIVVSLESLGEIAQTLQWAAQCLKEDRLTVVVTPEPWAFLGPEQQRIARLGRTLLRARVDALITVASDTVAATLGADWKPRAAQALLHATLTHIVQGITDTILRPGLIGVDFADVRTILKARGESRAVVGMGQGRQRAAIATRQAVAQLSAVCALYEAGGVHHQWTGYGPR